MSDDGLFGHVCKLFSKAVPKEEVPKVKKYYTITHILTNREGHRTIILGNFHTERKFAVTEQQERLNFICNSKKKWVKLEEENGNIWFILRSEIKQVHINIGEILGVEE